MTKSVLRLINATLTVAFLFCLEPAANADSGLQTSVAVDIVSETAVDQDSKSTDRMLVRESELMLYGPIDHYFDGRLSMAAHYEDGLSVFELHEAILSTSRLLPGLNIRAGQFFLGIGRLGQFHRHDWPFTKAPKAHEAFFDAEGVIDQGAEISGLIPISFFLELTAGVTNGYTYGHSHDAGEKPRKPTHYLRAATFFANGQWGLNYLNRKTHDAIDTKIIGLDWVSKTQDAATLRWLWQGEFWQRTVATEESDKEVSRGGYLFAQYGLTSHWSIGIRSDFHTVATAENAFGDKIPNHEIAFVPQINWKPSEFANLRLSFESNETKQDKFIVKNQLVMLQTTFLMGAHPAHDY